MWLSLPPFLCKEICNRIYCTPDFYCSRLFGTMSSKIRDDKTERKRSSDSQARREAIKIARLKEKQEEEARRYEDSLNLRHKKEEAKSRSKKEGKIVDVNEVGNNPGFKNVEKTEFSHAAGATTYTPSMPVYDGGNLRERHDSTTEFSHSGCSQLENKGGVVNKRKAHSSDNVDDDLSLSDDEADKVNQAI